MSDLEATVRELARKYALENAVKHGGKANPGAIIGKIMGENPDLRAHAKTVPALVAPVVAEVNALAPDAQRAAFEAYAAEFEAKAAAKAAAAEGRFPLKALPGAEKGKVVMRLAPNPSGPPHMGHARGFVINWAYKEHYDGRFILRYDDTDTTVKPPMPEAYGWILDGMRWLCGEPDRVFAASEHMEEYYRFADEAFKVGGAYVCECTGDAFRALKEQGEPCPHRAQSVEENLAKWRAMLDGRYKRGEVTVRIKTDIQHKDPALRDWVAFRIAEDPHPKVGAKYRVWPLLDFQSAIDDHLAGVTHIIRGKDLRDSTAKQAFLYEHLGWKYPETLYWGRVSIHEFGKFSKSILSEAIKRGEYIGWDDPRLPTLLAFRRRGFTPEGIRNFWLNLGLSEKDIAVSVVNLEAENRKVIEPIARRYFFVPEPVPVQLNSSTELVSTPPRHPDHPEWGRRTIHVRPGDWLVVPAVDIHAVLEDKGPEIRLRLKDLTNTEVQLPKSIANALRKIRNKVTHGGNVESLTPALKQALLEFIGRLETTKNISTRSQIIAQVFAFTGASPQELARGLSYDPRELGWSPPLSFWNYANLLATLMEVGYQPKEIEATNEGDNLAWAKSHNAPIVQWAPANGPKVRLVMPDATVLSGIAEVDLAKEQVGSIVQLERVGFARVDSISADGSLTLWYTHS